MEQNHITVMEPQCSYPMKGKYVGIEKERSI